MKTMAMNKLHHNIEPETKVTNPSTCVDALLKCAQSNLASMDANAIGCFSRLNAWKVATDRITPAQWDTIAEHLVSIQEHVLGVQDELVYFHDSAGEPEEMPVAVKCVGAEAGDLSVEDKLLRLGERAIYDAFQFETELKEVFGLSSVDGELDSALLPALEVVVEKADVATKQGLAMAALHKFIHGHPRGFGRYFDGSDRPYPRPSKEVQAEIDAKLPIYIAYLQAELAEAIEEEKENSRPDGVTP